MKSLLPLMSLMKSCVANSFIPADAPEEITLTASSLKGLRGSAKSAFSHRVRAWAGPLN